MSVDELNEYDFSSIKRDYLVHANDQASALVQIRDEMNEVEEVRPAEHTLRIDAVLNHREPLYVKWSAEVEQEFARADKVKRKWIDEFVQGAPSNPTHYKTHEIGRVLVRSLALCNERKYGECTWCGEPCSGRERLWHRICFATYTICRGDIPVFYQNFKHCIVCDKGLGWYGDAQVDHRLPLSLARVSNDPEIIAYAYSLDNLRPICVSCHKAKSKEDGKNLRGWLKHMSGGGGKTLFGEYATIKDYLEFCGYGSIP